MLIAEGVESSIRACGLGRSGGSVEFRDELTEHGRRVAVDGTLWCSSPRCARCGPILAGKLEAKYSVLIAAAEAAGISIAFMTLTARHSRNTRLADARKALGESLHRLGDGKMVRGLTAGGYRGFVRSWEVTDGKKTGWHLHAHCLIFHTGTLDDAVEAGLKLVKRWRALLLKRGWSSSNLGQDVRGVEPGQVLRDLSRYPEKAMKGWSPAMELAGAWFKEGTTPDRLSIPQLLGLAHAGDKWAAKRYAEAVQALSGQRLLVVGPRIKALLGLDAEADVDPSVDPEKDGEDVDDEGEIEPEKVSGRIIGEMTTGLWGKAAKRRLRQWVVQSVFDHCVMDNVEWCDVHALVESRVDSPDFQKPSGSKCPRLLATILPPSKA